MCDYPEFFRCTTPVAKKDHICYDCNRTIAAGTKYSYITGKSNGDFWYTKSCYKCDELRNYLQKNYVSIGLQEVGFMDEGYECGIPFGILRYIVVNNKNRIPAEILAAWN